MWALSRVILPNWSFLCFRTHFDGKQYGFWSDLAQRIIYFRTVQEVMQEVVHIIPLIDLITLAFRRCLWRAFVCLFNDLFHLLSHFCRLSGLHSQFCPCYLSHLMIPIFLYSWWTLSHVSSFVTVLMVFPHSVSPFLCPLLARRKDISNYGRDLYHEFEMMKS